MHLSDEQIERLAILSEELGEVQGVIGKIMRYGYMSYNPNDRDKIPNQLLLTKELGDVLHAVQLLEKNGEILISDIEVFAINKATKILPYLKYTEGL